MQLTLITPYRDRFSHLKNQLDWWTKEQKQQAEEKIEWFVVHLLPDLDKGADSIQDLCEQHQIRYLSMHSPDAFHKTKALNLALQEAQGEWIAAFDVDLLPVGDTLMRHCQLAQNSPNFLVTGYRLMAARETVDVDEMSVALEESTLGPEDQPTALRKYLLEAERFGVMPLFKRDRLLAIGGWDETFIGWGAEDQDVIERYLQAHQSLCRCPDLVYLHLKHQQAVGWNCEQLTASNRNHYYRKHRSQKRQYLSE